MTSTATCTRTPPSRTVATRWRRWPRPAASAATPTWRSPITPPATASATTSPRSGSGSGSTRSRDWNKGKRGFRLLAGSEVNIGLDGSLDYSEDVLAALDWVVASVHTSFAISEKEMTARVLAAIENPYVDCIGHLTGRLIGRREPYGVDVEAVAEAAARNGTMIEINGNPNRRDLSEQHARLANDGGRDDRPQHRCPRGGHAEQHVLRGGDRQASLADQGQSRTHGAGADFKAVDQAVGAAGPVAAGTPTPSGS